MKKILLDTHAFIWQVNGEAILTKSTRQLIDTAAQEGTLYLAAISLWEISMLDKKKRILLEMPCLEWINQALALTHAQILSLTPSIAVESCYLPGDFHEDPADRLIVSTARVENLAILTRDTRILSYGQNKYVTTIKI
jgi:PIN domain nuclease of toxin-antitoxin system